MNLMGALPGWPAKPRPATDSVDTAGKGAVGKAEGRSARGRATGPDAGSAEFSVALAGMMGETQPTPRQEMAKPNGEEAGAGEVESAETAALGEAGDGTPPVELAGDEGVAADHRSGGWRPGAQEGWQAVSGTVPGEGWLTPGEGMARVRPEVAGAAEGAGSEGRGGAEVDGIANGAAGGLGGGPALEGEARRAHAGGAPGAGEVGGTSDVALARDIAPDAQATTLPGPDGDLSDGPTISVLEVEGGVGGGRQRVTNELAEAAARLRLRGAAAGRGGENESIGSANSFAELLSTEAAASRSATSAASEGLSSETMSMAGDLEPDDPALAVALVDQARAELTEDDAERGAADGGDDRRSTAEGVSARAGEPRGGGGVGGASSPVAARGTDFASRVARVMELQDEIDAQPVTRVLLRLDDEGGAGGSVRVGLQGSVVEADIALADPRAATRLQARVDELTRALLRQGLEPGALQVEMAGRRDGTELLRGVGAGVTAAGAERLGIGQPMARGGTSEGRDENRAGNPERRESQLNQERSHKEQKREETR